MAAKGKSHWRVLRWNRRAEESIGPPQWVPLWPRYESEAEAVESAAWHGRRRLVGVEVEYARMMVMKFTPSGRRKPVCEFRKGKRTEISCA